MKGAALALGIALAGELSASAGAAPLQGAGAAASVIESRESPVATDVAWRHGRWVPGAIIAGAALGVLGAAAAQQSYAYCDPYDSYCGSYPAQDYYAYDPAPAYGFYAPPPAYGYYGHHDRSDGHRRLSYDLYGPGGDSRVSH